MRFAILLSICICGFSQALISAAPIGHYNPATGGISFTNLSDVCVLELYANGTPLARENAAGPVNLAMLQLAPNGMAWGTHSTPIGADFFGGNLLPPNMLLENASVFWFDAQGIYGAGTVVAVPEPGSLTLTLAAFSGIVALRRRLAK